MDSVLEHVLNPIAYLKELNRIIKESGVVYIGVPNEDCLFNDIKKLLYIIFAKANMSSRIKPFVSPYHVTGFNRRSITFASMKTNLKLYIIEILVVPMNCCNSIYSPGLFL